MEDRSANLGHVVIVGASGGIGQAIARTIARNYNCRLTLGYCRGKEVAEQLARQITLETTNPATACRLDVTGTVDLELALLEAQELHGACDVFIVCSGRAHHNLLQDMSNEEITELIAVNLTGVIRVCKYVLPKMLRRQSGKIILLSSIWGESGAALESVYSATKGGIITFAQALASEVGFSGIRVNVVAPGAIDTPMLDLLTPAQRQAVVAATPCGRLGLPEDIANLVAFLVSERADFIHGQVLSINGGFH